MNEKKAGRELPLPLRLSFVLPPSACRVIPAPFFTPHIRLFFSKPDNIKRKNQTQDRDEKKEGQAEDDVVFEK